MIYFKYEIAMMIFNFMKSYLLRLKQNSRRKITWKQKITRNFNQYSVCE